MLDQFDRRTFSAPNRHNRELSHDVYTRGDAGPTVVVLQELPGISEATVALTERLHQRGFRVVLPHLFGPLGRESMLGNLARVFCMRHEFRVFQSNQSSPIVDWLKALCRDLLDNHAATGVGVIGMCLTGNFAMALMADEAVLAGVASQPSLPLMKQSGLHLSSEEVSAVRTRLDQHGPMLAYRFEGDGICQADKFSALDSAFNDNAQRVRLHTIPGPGHAVLTRDFLAGGEPTQRALEQVVDYFHEKLHPPTRSPRETSS